MSPDLPPGPAAPPIVQLWRWAYRPVELLDACARDHGAWFTLRFPRGMRVVFAADPAAVKDIFAADPAKLHAGEGNFFLKPLLGEGSILVLDGAEHRRARRLMMPPFHGERMRAYGRTITDIAERRVAAWPRGRVIPLHHLLQEITLDAILAAVLGESPRVPELRARLIETLESTQSATDTFLGLLFLDAKGEPPLAGLMARLPFTRWGRFLAQRRAIDALLGAEVAARRAGGGAGRDDVLSLLAAAKDADGEALGDAELRDELITLLVAGHETSATALSWLFCLLASHPEAAARLKAEVGAERDPEKVARLPYLAAAIDESMRLHPVAPFVWRLLKEPMRLGGRDLPAGAAVAAPIYLVQRAASVWKDPESFRPERFLGASPAPWEFFPYGGGGRRCLGMAFAAYELKLVAAAVVRAADVRLAPGYRPRAARRGITLVPSDGAPVVLA